MPKAFPFTEAKVKSIPKPEEGRVYHKDSRFPGLQLCITSANGRTFYFVKRIDGKPTRIRLGTVAQLSVEQARTAAAEHSGTIASGRDPQAERRQQIQEPTISMLWQNWVKYNAHKKSTTVIEEHRTYKNCFLVIANRRLSSIKKSEVQALHARLGEEKGTYAANRALGLLRAMFNKGEDLGFDGKNPASGVKMFKEIPRDRFLHPQELEAFFKALAQEPPIYRDFFVVCLLTGARKGNVLRMKWTDLDLNAGYWRISDVESKNGRAMVIPLVAPALTILKARFEASNGSPWVFPGRKHESHLPTVQVAWERTVKRSGLTDLRIHDLRRSLGSWMAGQNVSLTIVGKVLGHKTPQATAIYARIGMDPQRAAMTNATDAMLEAAGVKMIEGHSTPITEENGHV